MSDCAVEISREFTTGLATPLPVPVAARNGRTLTAILSSATTGTTKKLNWCRGLLPQGVYRVLGGEGDLKRSRKRRLVGAA